MDRTASRISAVVAAAILLAVAAFPAVSIGTDEDDSEAIAPLVFGIGLGLSFIAGWYVNEYLDPDEAVPEPEDFNAAIYEAWLGSQLSSVTNAVQIDTQTLSLTNLHWSRNAEVVTADLWSASGDFAGSSDRILADSGTSSNLGNLMRSWESLIDQPFDAMASWPSESTSKGYNITYGFYAGDDQVDASLTLRYDAGVYVSPSAGADRVYLTSAGADNTRGMNTLYVIGPSGTLVSDSGRTFNLTRGTYSLDDLADGYYTLYGGPFVGPFMPAGDDPADLSGALVQICDGATRCLRMNGDTIVCDGAVVADAGIRATYGGGTEVVSAAGLIAAWDRLVGTAESIVANTVASAQAQWMLFDGRGSSSQFSSLSMYLPSLNNLDLTAEQRYMIGLLCMMENHAWYTGESTADTQIVPSDVTISKESLELKVSGTIDSADGAVAEDVVFTPLVWTDDIQLTAGGTTVWDQRGFAIVWGGAEDWDGNADISAVRLIALEPGMSIDADDIVYRGTSVPALTLDVGQIDIVLSAYAAPDLPSAGGEDYTAIVMAALVILGVLMMFFSVRSGRPLGLIVGALLVVAGIYASGAISDLIVNGLAWRSSPFGWWR